jgi:hypothetical protein
MELLKIAPHDPSSNMGRPTLGSMASSLRGGSLCCLHSPDSFLGRSEITRRTEHQRPAPDRTTGSALTTSLGPTSSSNHFCPFHRPVPTRAESLIIIDFFNSCGHPPSSAATPLPSKWAWKVSIFPEYRHASPTHGCGTRANALDACIRLQNRSCTNPPPSIPMSDLDPVRAV